MEIQKLTVTTPNPWGNDHVQGDLTIAPKVASATKGSDLLATLSSPGTQHDEDAHVAPEAMLSVYSVFTTHQPADKAVQILQVPNPTLSGIVFAAVPETSATPMALAVVLLLTLAGRHFRRR